ncbi:hypothetical protein PVAND_006183 [Polypedilum vanderplanki]|uniref:Uncharacterized protein n=1 Tax=Polypedilum vanderplanki TaxID=319348 RepID=A0A9J6C2C9_POLVA|nr:hypothetical protein PVAND_006183 [Polypedilum vanderplanki]
MGRVSKKAPETPKAAVEELPTVTQTRARRTPKPNPKYANDAAIIVTKPEYSESNGSTDIEDKLPESKIVKSTKKVISKIPEESKATKTTPAARGRRAASPTAIKKQKIEFDDDEKTKDADEIPINSPTPPPTGRTTRSGKDAKSEIKVGDDSVAIIDVSSIIAKGPPKQPENSPKTPVTTGRTVTRKRQAAEVVEVKEDSPKKKKEEEKPSLITARKSYMPTGKKEEEEETKPEEVKKEATSPANTIKTRRNATQQAQVIEEKKPKLEETKVEPKTTSTAIVKTVAAEPKKLPVVRKEAITKLAPVASTPSLPTKTSIVNTKDIMSRRKSTIVTTTTSPVPAPAPRVLNSMVTPKGAKLSPNVKLAQSDDTDKKVFSIEMSDGSLVEKKPVASPVKVTPSAVKENAIPPKPQPSMLLKNKLESELNRMKASANLMKRQMITPQIRQSPAAVQAQLAARRVTKFESWYVIDVKSQDYHAPIKHIHTYSLIKIGNKIKEIQLPSTKWDYKVTLQKKQMKKQNNNDDDELYTGEVDKSMEAERHTLEPTSILFKRSYKDSNKTIIDRSVMLKQNTYAITMDGKQCQLIGAPNDIKSIEDLEILLKTVDTISPSHSWVESSS